MIMVTIVITLGMSLVKPSDCFMVEAHTTSNMPARTR